jgi:hypothetical protein
MVNNYRLKGIRRWMAAMIPKRLDICVTFTRHMIAIMGKKVRGQRHTAESHLVSRSGCYNWGKTQSNTEKYVDVPPWLGWCESAKVWTR